MTKKLSMFALIACMAGSLAFASDGANGAMSASSAGKTSCPTTNENKDKKKEHNAKQAPSKEEQEFDHMLLGIHG